MQSLLCQFHFLDQIFNFNIKIRAYFRGMQGQVLDVHIFKTTPEFLA